MHVGHGERDKGRDELLKREKDRKKDSTVKIEYSKREGRKKIFQIISLQ